MKTYTFIKHPIEALHGFVTNLLPGVEKVITIYSDDESEKLIGHLTEKSNREYQTSDLDIDDIKGKLLRYMQEKVPHDWFNRQNHPFNLEKKSKNLSPDIFSELQNVILLLRFPEKNKLLSSLVFIFLNDNPGNFGVTNSSNSLTTDNKSIIAFLLRNYISSFLEQQTENISAHNDFIQHTQKILKTANKYKIDLEETREYYGQSLVKLCLQILRTVSMKNRKTYALTDDAVNAIKNYKGDLKELEKKIYETISYIDNLYSNKPDEIEISAMFLDLDNDAFMKTKQPLPNEKEDKYTKTVYLLNRLEESAIRVLDNKLKMTGTNVGQHCEVPISAPAISDALNKHKFKINQLVKMHPEKWPTIRNEFRPVKNVLESEK